MNAPLPESPPAAPQRKGWLLLAVALLLGLAAYSNALGGAFVFDDVSQIRDTALAHDLGLLWGWGSIRTMPRWLAYLTFALNFRAGGPSPAGYHVVNVAIHLGCAALVWALVRLAFRTPRLAGSALAPRSDAVAFVAAALFVAHPIQTQAVTYVVQRMTSLAALLYLGAVVLYLRWRLADLANPARPRADRLVGYGAVLAVALLAMKTKEIAVTLPVAVALSEVTFFRTTRRDLLPLLPIGATALVVPATWLLAPAAAGGGATALDAVTRIQTTLPRLDYLATQLAVIVTYLFLLVAPVGQNVDHDYPIHHSFLAPEVLSAAVVLGALAGLCAWLLARTRASAARPLDPAARLAGFGIAWWFLALSVESSVIPIVDVINEHRVYLPSAGLLVAAAVGVAALARRTAESEPAFPRRTVAAGAVLAVVLGAATFARNRVWASDIALWTDAAKKSPEKSRPYLNLGTALREAGRPEAATAALRRGVELDGTSAYGRSQLGAVLLSLGRRAEAERELRAALALAPNDPEALFNLATLFWEQGRPDDARFLYARFAEVAPPTYQAARRVARTRVADLVGGAPRDPPAGVR